jgi:hypothetical protein
MAMCKRLHKYVLPFQGPREGINMHQLRWMVASVATLFALACSSPMEFYLMSDARKKVAEEWEPAGGGCSLAISSNGVQQTTTAGTVEQDANGNTVVSDDYVLEERYDGQTVEVSVSSGGEVIAERRYDAAFLVTGDVDVIEVTTKRGDQYELRYWGGPACDTRLPEQ